MLEAHDLSGEEEEHLDGHGRDDDDGGNLIGDDESDNLVMIKVIIMEIVRDYKSEIDGCPLSLCALPQHPNLNSTPAAAARVIVL